ncbi:MAG: AraC family transcriptional regulator [Deltaproteobacteria bacterium]|nr:AraC family transcriptional regulator [Deltaproteobacteria bacterium]
MDVLTEVIRAGRPRTLVQGRLELTAPWGVRVDGARNLAFYAVVRGAVVLGVRDARIQLGAGDLVFLRKGLAHTIKDHVRSRASPVAQVYAQRGGRCGGIVQFGGGGAPTTLISGAIAFDSNALDLLVACLPEVIHVPGDARAVVHWLDSTLYLLATEMDGQEPGYELVASRLADVLFVHALRSHVKRNPCEVGWMTAISDAQVGVAFQRMHERPGEPWTVASLAREAGMSRAAFAARFKAVLGIAPLAYLTKWRIHHASDLLGSSARTIGDIAGEVGYETESAFTKVFKRHLGETPGAYRRRLRGA